MLSKHRRGEEQTPEQLPIIFKIRQILNIIFMIGAVIGMLLYFFGPNDLLGIIVIIAAMSFKMAECVLRLMK